MVCFVLPDPTGSSCVFWEHSVPCEYSVVVEVNFCYCKKNLNKEHQFGQLV